MNVPALNHQAAEYLAQEKYEEAIAIYQQYIENYPTDRANYWRLGLVYLLQRKESLAQELWWSIMLQGTSMELETWTVELIDLLDTEATHLQEISKFPQAEIIYRQILEFNPELPKIHNKLGNTLLAQNQLEAALSCYEQAINLDPNFFMAYNNQGTVFEKQNKFEAAVICYQRAIDINPNIVQPYYNMGLALENQGEFAKGINYCHQAIALNPNKGETHLSLGMMLLRMGEFELGFAEYEWRTQVKKNQTRSFPQPVWNGSDLEGKRILLHHEQGFGDTIQAIRYATKVQAHGGKVIVLCPQSLVRLLTTCAGINQLVITEAELPPFDVHAPLMSLPRIFGTTLATIPCSIPYLSPPKSLHLQLEQSTTNQLKIGIVWAGNPNNIRDRSRSCSLTDFQELLQISGISFYSLQKGPRALDLAQLPSEIVIQDLSSDLGDFADTAAIISQLDLVITVDTAVAHLTGALGKPVWVILSFVSDWRWLLEREDSPWYPTMRLFRQNRLGDWTGVFKRIAQQLQNLVHHQYRSHQFFQKHHDQ